MSAIAHYYCRASFRYLNVLIILIKYNYSIMARRRSNTVGNKIKEEEALLLQKSSCPAIHQQPALAKILMRRTNKPAHIVQIVANGSGQRIFELIQKQFYISIQNQILFFKGQMIKGTKQNQRRNFPLLDKDIIHVHNKEYINRSTINITLAFLNNELIKFNQLALTVRPKDFIGLTLEEALICEAQIVGKSVYAQSGRFLNTIQTFENESVEDGSIIIVVNRKTPISTLCKLQQRQMELVQSKSKINKKYSMNAMVDLQTPNFKKKCQGNVYRSKLIPQSKQLVWQQDSNSDFSKKILVKRLIKKCQKKIDSGKGSKQYINLSIRSNYGSSQKDMKALESSFKLKIPIEKKQSLQFSQKRLSYSACLIKSNQIKNFKAPPKIAQDENDEFEQIQEVQFLDQDMDIQMEIPTSTDLNSSAPLASFSSFQNSLKCSVGKTRGVFVPIVNGSLPPALLQPDDDDEEEYEDF